MASQRTLAKTKYKTNQTSAATMNSVAKAMPNNVMISLLKSGMNWVGSLMVVFRLRAIKKYRRSTVMGCYHLTHLETTKNPQCQ